MRVNCPPFMQELNRAAVMLAEVGAVLLVVSIKVLQAVLKPGFRLGLICFFTVIIVLSLKTLTNTRRAEVFGSTAA